jgi:Tol biopolymer transport system component
VAGGKGAARAVDGIPFVVAWSPDSQSLAFGSITGEPYVLGVLRSPGSPNPTLGFAEVRGGYIGELAWSPDGKYLAISTYSLDRRNHTVLIAAGSTGLVRTLIDGCHITWSPDSKYIAIHRDPGVEGGAWVVSATDKEDRWPISREEKAFPLTWRN